MKQLKTYFFATAVLVLTTLIVQPVSADEIFEDPDPTIQMGLNATLPVGASFLTESSLTWSYAYAPPAGDTNYIAYFLNSTANKWTDMTIVATEGGSTSTPHTYTNEAFSSSLFPAGTTAAYTTIDPASPSAGNGGTVVTYHDSGGTGVAIGSYLAVRFNNFASGPPNTTFQFTASINDAVAAPEPPSIALLGMGLLALLGLVGFGRRRPSAI